MSPALLITLLLTQAPPPTGATGAPSDEPTPAAETATAAKNTDRDALLKGFDLSLTVFNSSGVYFGAEGYTNTFTLWVEPSFAIGARLFRGSWLEKLSFSARLPIEAEVIGNDARFRGTGFASSALYNPEALAVIDSQPGAVDGAAHRTAILGDAWLSLAHGRLFTIPGLAVDASSSLRAAIPTSTGSRNAGLLTALGLGLNLERKFFERLSLGWSGRATKYFYSRTHGSIAPLGTTFELNGNPEVTWTPSSTGIANPDYGFINGFFASLELPRGFSLEASYFLSNTKPYPNNGGCRPIDLAGVDTCADGLAVSRSITPSPWRNEHWFTASVDFKHSFWGLSLGLSTFRQLESTFNSRAPTNAAFESSRNNYTTIYLSLSASAEGFAGFVTGNTEEKKQ